MFHADEPTRAEIDQLPGAVVLEFGASWCGHCLAVQGDLMDQLRRFPELQHIKIEDGKGQPLGRSFGVKLWPTLVFLHNGQIVARIVRPDENEMRAAFEQLAGLIAPGPERLPS